MNRQIIEMYDEVLPRSTGPNTLPNAIRFAALLNQAKATRTGAVQSSKQDLVADLAGILEQWPSDVDLQVRSFVMSAGTVRLELSVQSNERASQIIQSFDQLPEWEINNRSMTPRSEQVDLSMTLSQRAREEHSS